MTSFYVEVRYHVDERADLDSHVDQLMDALGREPRLVDPDVGVNLRERTIEVCATVEAPDQPEALRTAMVRVQSALHGLGLGTAGWAEYLQSTVRPNALAS